MFSVKTERSNVVIAEVSDGLQAMPQVQVCGNTYMCSLNTCA